MEFFEETTNAIERTDEDIDELINDLKKGLERIDTPREYENWDKNREKREFNLSLYRERQREPLAYLSSNERVILNELNKARTNPKEYANFLETTVLNHLDDKLLTLPNGEIIQTEEGSDAVKDAIQYLRAIKPVEKLWISPGMCKGARRAVDRQGTSTETPTDTLDRFRTYGEMDGAGTEIVNFGITDPIYQVIAFIVNDADLTRNTRERVLDGRWKFIGICFNRHYSKYAFMTVMMLAEAYESK